MAAQASTWQWSSSNPAAANVPALATAGLWQSTTDITAPVGAILGSTAVIFATARWDTTTHLGSATGSMIVTVGLVPGL